MKLSQVVSVSLVQPGSSFEMEKEKRINPVPEIRCWCVSTAILPCLLAYHKRPLATAQHLQSLFLGSKTRAKPGNPDGADQHKEDILHSTQCDQHQPHRPEFAASYLSIILHRSLALVAKTSAKPARGSWLLQMKQYLVVHSPEARLSFHSPQVITHANPRTRRLAVNPSASPCLTPSIILLRT